MARRATLRASDFDRERIAERLRHATGEGRLLAEELEERLGAVFSARTYGELDTLVADLPGERLERRGKLPVRSRVGAAVVLAIAAAMLAVVVALVLVILLTGVFAIWAMWVVWGWWFFGRGRGYGRRRARARRSRRLGETGRGPVGGFTPWV